MKPLKIMTPSSTQFLSNSCDKTKQHAATLRKASSHSYFKPLISAVSNASIKKVVAKNLPHSSNNDHPNPRWQLKDYAHRPNYCKFPAPESRNFNCNEKIIAISLDVDSDPGIIEMTALASSASEEDFDNLVEAENNDESLSAKEEGFEIIDESSSAKGEQLDIMSLSPATSKWQSPADSEDDEVYELITLKPNLNWSEEELLLHSISSGELRTRAAKIQQGQQKMLIQSEHHKFYTKVKDPSRADREYLKEQQVFNFINTTNDPELKRICSCQQRLGKTQYARIRCIGVPVIEFVTQETNSSLKAQQAITVCQLIFENLKRLFNNCLQHNDLHLENMQIVKDESSPYKFLVEVYDWGLSTIEKEDPNLNHNDIRYLLYRGTMWRQLKTTCSEYIYNDQKHDPIRKILQAGGIKEAVIKYFYQEARLIFETKLIDLEAELTQTSAEKLAMLSGGTATLRQLYFSDTINAINQVLASIGSYY